MGSNAGNASDQDAFLAMRLAVVEVPIVSTIVIDAGERDEAPIRHGRSAGWRGLDGLRARWNPKPNPRGLRRTSHRCRHNHPERTHPVFASQSDLRLHPPFGEPDAIRCASFAEVATSRSTVGPLAKLSRTIDLTADLRNHEIQQYRANDGLKIVSRQAPEDSGSLSKLPISFSPIVPIVILSSTDERA